VKDVDERAKYSLVSLDVSEQETGGRSGGWLRQYLLGVVLRSHGDIAIGV